MRLRRLAVVGALALSTSASAPPDDLDAFIATEMARRQVVGLSLAIIHDGRIEARAYGTTERNGTKRVTPTTLFQAGSISKPVAAVGALRLVEQGKLSLDEDVNARLKSWQVPSNQFTTTEHVTLRRLLSHTAGLTVHGFPGYAVTETMPTVVDVLNGRGNTPAIVVDVLPGSIWRYSGGGYTVMQQLVSDVSGKSFPDYMRANVLQPLGMTNSSYQQPPSREFAARTATGYYSDRSEVTGRWHVYPEMAAAGLWTTATDLAKYAIGVQQMLAGKSKVLSAAMAKQMLTQVKGGYGLGVGLQDTGRVLRFSHGGRDEGFDAMLVAYAYTGDGVAIMINANDNSGMAGRIAAFVAKKYNWPNYTKPAPLDATKIIKLPAEALHAVEGRYEFSNNNMITLYAENGRLYNDAGGLPDEEFAPVGADQFTAVFWGNGFKVLRDTTGRVTGLEWQTRAGPRRIPRIGPLFGSTTTTDPDPVFTRNLQPALELIAAGRARESNLVTVGMARDFTAPIRELKGASNLVFVGSENVGGRGISRHGHDVGRVNQYRLDTANGPLKLIVHLDSQGLITDFDIVSR